MENYRLCIIAISIMYILRKVPGILFENNEFSFILGLHFNVRYDLNWLICPRGFYLLKITVSLHLKG